MAITPAGAVVGSRSRVTTPARLGFAAFLGAGAVLGQLASFGLGGENPGYQAQLSAGRTAWLCAGCLAAALAAPGWRGWLAAWAGALAGTIRVVDQVVASSPTLQSDPFWWNVGVVGWAAFAGVLLAVGQGVVLLSSRARRRWGRVLPLALVALLAASSAVLLWLPEPAYDGPRPAPTAPSEEAAP